MADHAALEQVLRRVDLNLLIPLSALLSERHVTRAAVRVGLSQPTMSRVWGRLREQFSDPLLVTTTNDLCLTPRGHELEQALPERIVVPKTFYAKGLSKPDLINVVYDSSAQAMHQLEEDPRPLRICSASFTQMNTS
ncbi:MAG: LysR family transcriptional regulator [Myxococcota bacterium]